MQKKAPFGGGDRRFKTTQRMKKDQPGPGAYENEQTVRV